MIEGMNWFYDKIWQVSEQALSLNENVILDLGFTIKEQKVQYLLNTVSAASSVPLELSHNRVVIAVNIKP